MITPEQAARLKGLAQDWAQEAKDYDPDGMDICNGSEMMSAQSAFEKAVDELTLPRPL